MSLKYVNWPAIRSSFYIIRFSIDHLCTVVLFTYRVQYCVLVVMNSLLFLVLVLCARWLGLCEATTSEPESEPALLIVSYDGFKPEYMYRNVTPNLDKFRREGTTARYMNPVFPTKTFVNHFTIATVSEIV